MGKHGLAIDRRSRRPPRVLGEDDAWALVRALLRAVRTGAIDPDGGIACSISGDVSLQVRGRGKTSERAWEVSGALSPVAEELLDLYVPLCVARRGVQLVAAHLGQSLDGRVASPAGAPRFLTGPEDIRHMHRLRALFDAVVVGANTALIDDPQLTTRLVSGSHPVRVVLDPRARLPHGLRVFSDAQAPTIVIVGAEHARAHAAIGAGVEVIGLGLSAGRLVPSEVLAALRSRGLSRVFIEGGGVTVSRFLEARAIDRLQVAITPKIVGTGAPALQVGGLPSGMDFVALGARRFLLGTDVLFDCELPGEHGTA